MRWRARLPEVDPGEIDKAEVGGQPEAQLGGVQRARPERTARRAGELAARYEVAARLALHKLACVSRALDRSRP